MPILRDRFNNIFVSWSIDSVHAQLGIVQRASAVPPRRINLSNQIPYSTHSAAAMQDSLKTKARIHLFVADALHPTARIGFWKSESAPPVTFAAAHGTGRCGLP